MLAILRHLMERSLMAFEMRCLFAWVWLFLSLGLRTDLLLPEDRSKEGQPMKESANMPDTNVVKKRDEELDLRRLINQKATLKKLLESGLVNSQLESVACGELEAGAGRSEPKVAGEDCPGDSHSKQIADQLISDFKCYYLNAGWIVPQLASITKLSDLQRVLAEIVEIIKSRRWFYFRDNPTDFMKMDYTERFAKQMEAYLGLFQVLKVDPSNGKLVFYDEIPPDAKEFLPFLNYCATASVRPVLDIASFYFECRGKQLIPRLCRLMLSNDRNEKAGLRRVLNRYLGQVRYIVRMFKGTPQGHKFEYYVKRYEELARMARE